MATVGEISNQIRSKIYGLGRVAVNALFPLDCEYYMVSLELVDSKDRTVDFLAFPVMPSQIQESRQEKTSIVETAGGVVSITSPTFKPRDITISGNFGRGVFMNAGSVMSFTGLRYSTNLGIYRKEDMHPQNASARALNFPFNPFIKTGYGFIKVLEAIIDKASGVDDSGLPMRLYFYNTALGNNYVVDPTQMELKQDKGSNMVWGYTVNMKATAPLSIVKGGISSRLAAVAGATFALASSKALKAASSIKV